MQKALVDKQEKAVYTGAFPMQLEDPGLALVFGIVSMGVSPTDLEKAMDHEIELVQQELISEIEFQKLRNQIENDRVSNISTMAGISESLADYSVYFKNTNLINTEINRYMKVTKEDIQRVAQKYFVKENRVVLYYLPKNKGN